jgi:hypothetical protein
MTQLGELFLAERNGIGGRGIVGRGSGGFAVEL